jgi:hypothetical protein
MNKVLLGCFLLCLPFFSFGQEKPEKSEFEEIKVLEDTLAVLSFAMINDSTPVKRFASCQKFIKVLVRALKNPNSFDYPFERIRTVSILYPPDSTFRIFSWQLYVDKDDYHYYGTIQMNSPELKMYPLIDRSGEVTNPEIGVFDNDNWYGALYYNIMPYPKAKNKYLLFGYDAFQFFNKRKLVEVLTFEDGKAKFGEEVFEVEMQEGETRMVDRFVLEYGADAKVKLNYDEQLEMIIFDHLIPMGSPYPGQNVMFVPDGDIDGLYFEKGKWKFKARIFDQTMEEPPRPEPILDKKDKDLFGN